MFYRPQAAAEEKARIEALAKQQEADRIAAEQKRAEDARLKAEQDANTAADADEAANKEATFNIISAPTGRYYIVLNSFLDADMAADYGNKLKAKGVGTTLLAPKGGKKFNRLALADNFGTFLEAQEEANKRKAEFSNDLWVLKY